MTILDWAIWLEQKHADPYYKYLVSVEVSHFSKSTREKGYFTELYYSFNTGWSQVLYYSPNPQTETGIVRIDYYPTAVEAICDNSIFPPDIMVYMI